MAAKIITRPLHDVYLGLLRVTSHVLGTLVPNLRSLYSGTLESVVIGGDTAKGESVGSILRLPGQVHSTDTGRLLDLHLLRQTRLRISCNGQRFCPPWPLSIDSRPCCVVAGLHLPPAATSCRRAALITVTKTSTLFLPPTQPFFCPPKLVEQRLLVPVTTTPKRAVPPAKQNPSPASPRRPVVLFI